MDTHSMPLSIVERAVRLPTASAEDAETAEQAIACLLAEYGLDDDDECGHLVLLYSLLVSHNLAMKGAEPLAPKGRIPTSWSKVTARLVRLTDEHASSLHKHLKSTERELQMVWLDREMLAAAIVVKISAAIHATGEPLVVIPSVDQLLH